MELLKFLAGPTANEVLAKYLALQPAHRDVVPEYISLMRSSTGTPTTSTCTCSPTPARTPIQSSITPNRTSRKVLADAYRRIFHNREPVGSVWPEAIERLNRLLATAARSTGPQQVAWAGVQWTAQDINAKLPGAQVREDGALVVSGPGSDIWSYQDGMHFVYQEAEETSR